MQWEQTVYWYALSISIIRQNAAFVKGFFAGKCGWFYTENYRLTFFAKCGILDFEGIPETVGGLFLLPLLIGTDGRWLHWIVLLHFVICWKSERFWFLWQHLSLHCIKNMATVITRRKRNNRPWSSPTCDGYSITYSQMGADRLLVCSLYFYYTRFWLICQVIFILAKTTGTMVWHFLRNVI